jgi:hypothetical protein
VVRVRLAAIVDATELRSQLGRERVRRLGRLEQLRIQLRLGQLVVERRWGIRGRWRLGVQRW